MRGEKASTWRITPRLGWKGTATLLYWARRASGGAAATRRARQRQDRQSRRDSGLDLSVTAGPFVMLSDTEPDSRFGRRWAPVVQAGQTNPRHGKRWAR